MPTSLRIGPYRFYFYSYDCNEPKHVHIDRDNQSVKFWLDPVISLAHNHGYKRSELRKIEQLVYENLEQLNDAWDAFCGQ